MAMENSEVVSGCRVGTGNLYNIFQNQTIAIGRVGSDAGSLIWDAISFNRTAGVCTDGENVKNLADLW